MQVRRRRYDRTVLVPGQTLQSQERYAVGEEIGEGGYAIVYSATTSKGQRVALKEFIPGNSVVEREQVRRLFLRERDVLWGLRMHPHLPDLIEAFSQDGLHYLVLEFVEGESLRERIDREGPIPPDQVGPLSLQLTRAVASLHTHGIVHHDIKPGNVKLGPTGLAVLLDLGSARSVFFPSEHLQPLLRTAEGGAMGAGPATQITGTPGYMAPELREMVESNTLQSSYALDVFALGCSVYELVTGKRLAQSDIDAQNEAAIAQAVQEVKTLAPTLAGPVAGALKTQTRERYSSARELLAELTQVVPPRPAVRREILEFDLSSARGEVEQHLVITNAGGGTLTGTVRVLHPALSFRRPDGEDTHELHFEGNVCMARLLANVARAAASPEETGRIEVQTPHGQLQVTCRFLRAAIMPMRLVVQPARVTLTVTRQTVQQVQVRVRNDGGASGRVLATVSPPEMVLVTPGTTDIPPGDEVEFCVRPAIATLRPGTHTAIVTFCAESPGSSASIQVTLRVRGRPRGVATP